MAYNEAHGIIPQTIKKDIHDDIKATIIEEASENYNIDKNTDIKELINTLTDKMLEHAQKMEFEEAAKLRDQIRELEKLI